MTKAPDKPSAFCAAVRLRTSGHGGQLIGGDRRMVDDQCHAPVLDTSITRALGARHHLSVTRLTVADRLQRRRVEPSR